MADAALQALLDPDGMGTGIRLIRRVDDGTNSHYYVIGVAYAQGEALWIPVVTANTDAQKNTAIRAALGVA